MTDASAQAESAAEKRWGDYRITILHAHELGALTPLFVDAFGHGDFGADRLQRKYAHGTEGIDAFVCAALTDAGEAAGAVGVLPWAARYGERVEVGGQMVDVATSSAHRGRGLFVLLAEVAREVATAAGVSFLYGFPNEAAYPIWLNKLGYEHFDDLVEYRLPVRTLWVERAAQRVAPARRRYALYVERTLEAHGANEPLPNSFVAEGFAGIDRDGDFFAYKAAVGGSRIVTVAGGRAWLAVHHGIVVGDLEASTPVDVEATTNALARLAWRLGAHQIVVISSKGTRFDRLLPPRFRVSPGLPIIYRNIHSEIPREKLRFSFGTIDNF